MKLLYIVPGMMKKAMGEKELDRRLALLREWAFTDTSIDIIDIEDGPLSIESSLEEYMSVNGVINVLIKAEKEGYDGAIIGCFDDPGIDAAREVVSIPVVGPGEASLLLSCMLGTSYSIISISDNVVPSLKKRAKVVGVYEKMCSIRSINTPVLEMPKDIELTINKVKAAAFLAKNTDGADVLVLGCMSMAFLDFSHLIEKELGIPVINPAKVALKTLEGLIGAGLSHSKKSYPYPLKWAKNKNI